MNHQGQLLPYAGDLMGNLHKNSRQPRVFLARNAYQPESGVREWSQHGLTLVAAIDLANEYQQAKMDDCYFTPHGYGWERRTGKTVSSVTQLTCFWVDFDYYNTEYSHLSAGDFAALVCRENSWMPEPTFISDSGKGCWMYWKFQRPVHLTENTAKWNFLAQWQTAQVFLVSQLVKYGADSNCCDAARVVRLPETINSKNGRKAEVWESGQSYKFGDIKKIISARFRELNPKRQLLPSDQPKLKTKPKKASTSKVSDIFTWNHLAWKRMLDLKKLAVLRGGRLTDNRRMAAWAYAVAAANYCRDEQSLRAEVTGFINGYLANPERKIETINYESTVNRFKNHLELRQLGMNKDEIRKKLGYSKDKYQNTTKYIIKTLGVTEAEQRKLQVIIGQSEKNRRDLIRKERERREAGCKTREEYNDQRKRSMAENVSEALILFAKHQSIREVAKVMGRSKTTVHRWINTV